MKLNKGIRPSPIVMRQKLRDFERLRDNIKNVKTTIDNSRKESIPKPNSERQSKSWSGRLDADLAYAYLGRAHSILTDGRDEQTQQREDWEHHEKESRAAECENSAWLAAYCSHKQSGQTIASEEPGHTQRKSSKELF